MTSIPTPPFGATHKSEGYYYYHCAAEDVLWYFHPIKGEWEDSGGSISDLDRMVELPAPTTY